MPSARTGNSDWRSDPLLAEAREPLCWLTPERRIAMVNRAWEELTGYTSREVIGVECRPHGPTRPGDLAGLGGSFYPPAEAMAGQPASTRTTIVGRRGERLDRRIEFWPFHLASGELQGLLGIVRPAEDRAHAADSESQSLRTALLDLRSRIMARHAHDLLIGTGSEHQRLLDGVDLAIVSSVPVTIVGEPGTGRRTVARIIHQRSPRRQLPLLGYDCRAIPPELLERELFGSAESTGSADRLVAPEGATVVLGDVLLLPRDLQTRLAASLRGSNRGSRLIATTGGDLEEALRTEQFRPDLYHALTTLVLHLQPLRERLDDLPVLAQSLLERANLRAETARSGFEPAALAGLLAYDWPGNLRELAEVIDEAHARATIDLIRFADLPPRIRGQQGGAYLATSEPTPRLRLKEQLLKFERQVIEEALTQAHQNKTRAARRLGVNRPFLYRRIKELGIADPDATTDEGADAPEWIPPVDNSIEIADQDAGSAG